MGPLLAPRRGGEAFWGSDEVDSCRVQQGIYSRVLPSVPSSRQDIDTSPLLSYKRSLALESSCPPPDRHGFEQIGHGPLMRRSCCRQRRCGCFWMMEFSQLQERLRRKKLRQGRSLLALLFRQERFPQAVPTDVARPQEHFPDDAAPASRMNGMSTFGGPCLDAEVRIEFCSAAFHWQSQ
jgi:hypothetical protein